MKKAARLCFNYHEAERLDSMTILGIDSSGIVASVALYTDGVIRAEYSVNYKKTHSQTLLPMIDEIMSMTETEKSSLTAIAVASGPGSFTGLRIGAATAKGLGLALKLPLLPVPTLEGLSYRFIGSDALVCPLMDARRNQVYTGIYSFEDGFHPVLEQAAISIEELIERVNAIGQKTIFLGDGVAAYEEQLVKQLKLPYRFAKPHQNLQSAAAVAVRGADLLEKGYSVSADAFAPEYLRLSQAEREREHIKRQRQQEEHIKG